MRLHHFIVWTVFAIVAHNSVAQGVESDTLDWRGYYPLQIGNVWEWDRWQFVDLYRVDRREIVGDTIIGGTPYVVQRDTGWETDRDKRFFRLRFAQDSFLRYDTLSTRVVRLDESGAERDHTCDLTAAFGTEVTCALLGEARVEQGGPVEYAPGGTAITFASSKSFNSGVSLITYVHGFGEMAMTGEGLPGSVELVHLILDGESYGKSVIQQEMKIIGSSPADADSAVVLNTTVSFDFTLPIDTTARFSRDLPVEFLAISPPDSIRIDSVYYSPDLTTLYLDVQHTDNTDFVWIATGARSTLDESMCRLHSLSYTTSAERGRWAVRGFAGAVVPVKTNYCFDLVAMIYNRLPVNDGYPVGADVVDWVEYEFEIAGVRDGIYWAAVGGDINGNGRIGDVFVDLREIVFSPWYEEPDSFVVAGGDVEGIELTIAYPGSAEGVVGTRSWLEPVYPNPLRYTTTLTFESERPGTLTIDLYDILGRRVLTIADGFHYPGSHSRTLDVTHLAPGVYFLRLRSGAHVESQSLVVTR